MTPRDREPVSGDLAHTLTSGRRAVIVVAVMLATLMEVLDISIVNVSLPDMQGELGATFDEISWVATGYIISNVVILPLTGWLSDYFGRKRYLVYSVVLFTAASLGAGSSQSLLELVMFRVAQGAGGAAFLSTAQATMVEIFPKERQGFAQATFAIGVVMAPTLGPTLGGYLTDRFSWPWIFFVNVPVGVVAAILTALYVPDSGHAGRRTSPDVIGIGFLAVGLGCLQTVLERGERDDWFQASYLVVLSVTSAVALGLFCWWELRPENHAPAVNFRVLANRNLLAGCLFALALGFALYGGVLILPQYLQNVTAHTAEESGVLLIPGGLATVLVLPLVGQLVGRIDTRALIGFGGCALAVSCFDFAFRLTVAAPDSAIFLPLVLRGVGVGFQFVPLSVVALVTLRPDRVGQGAGLFNLCRQLGGSFGIALLATILDRREKLHYARLTEHLDSISAGVQGHLAALQAGFVASGQPPGTAHRTALAALAASVERQAYDLSFLDAFRIMGYVTVAAFGLLALFKKAKGRPPVAAR